MNPYHYWSVFAKLQFPLLSPIAIRLFMIPTSSAASERAWNIFSFIQNKRSNRLTNDKIEKLVFMYINYSLLDENDTVDYARIFINGEDEDLNDHGDEDVDGNDDGNENNNNNNFDDEN